MDKARYKELLGRELEELLLELELELHGRGERERRERRKLIRRKLFEARIKAAQIALESYRFGTSPMEDEEIPDFASPFAKKIAHDGFMPEISLKLCPLCTDIPIKWLLDSPQNAYTHFRSIDKLMKSAESCGLCKLILGTLKDFTVMPLLGLNIIIAPQFLIVEVLQQSFIDYRVLRLCTDPDSEAARMGVEVGLPILRAGGELLYSILKEWLNDCDERHIDHKFDLKNLPKRVLYVGTTEKPELRLYESIKGECKKIYMALSHRWGEDKHRRPLSTTKENQEAHRKSINFDDLPKTFQDAVKVTRELGIQYLWIDSLCIVQNDDEDWKTESRCMEAVFANAFCTIAATSAKDSWDGFLVSQSIKQSVKLVDSSVNPPLSVYACEVGGNFNNDVGSAELNRRAWVLQERALSPRTIHFTAAQTYWECGSVIRCDNLLQMVKPSDLLSSSRFPMTISGPPVGGAASAFEDIVTRYSKLGLSKPTDRPYAIAGLQSRLENLYNTKSTHGIAHCCLLKSLLWQRADKNKRMKEIDDAKSKTIPSWSWMKYQGGIRYGKIPADNVSWNREIKLIKPDSNNEEWYVLKAPVVRISHGYSVEPWQRGDCKIKDSNGRLSGWIRFDDNDETDIGNLGCIIIAQQKSVGWTVLGQDGWKQFAYLDGSTSSDLSNVSYVLMVSNAVHEQGYEVEVCRRLGVAAIQSGSFSSSPQTAWAWVM